MKKPILIPSLLRLTIVTSVLLAVDLALTGCSSTNISQLAGALAKDPAIVKVKVGSVYGTLDFTRIGCPTNGMTITPDGTITVTGSVTGPAPIPATILIQGTTVKP